MNSIKQIKRLHNDVRRWCGAPTSVGPPRLHDEILTILKGKHPRTVQAASVNVALLANWHGQRGVASVLDGREDGWDHIERSLQYLCWAIKVEPANAMVSRAACCLAHALVSADDSSGDFLWERLLRSIDDNGFLTWKHSPFATFMLHLWPLYRQRPLPKLDYSKIPSPGRYQEVIDGWVSGSGLESALGDLCDYHLEQTRDSEPLPEFIHPPYQLFPVEVIAISRTRTSLGLSTPTVSHPLLSTPLGAPPVRPNISVLEEDQVLQQLVSRARETGAV